VHWTHQPDVIVMDIGMPRLNGYDTARKIRKQPWADNVVLIALTGWGQTEDKRRAKEAGFDHHLVKPVDPTTLARIINIALAQARTNRPVVQSYAETVPGREFE
jgi:CheY-like chemotaxis protein